MFFIFAATKTTREQKDLLSLFLLKAQESDEYDIVTTYSRDKSCWLNLIICPDQLSQVALMIELSRNSPCAAGDFTTFFRREK